MMILTAMMILLSSTGLAVARGATMEVVVAPDNVAVHIDIVLRENMTSLPMVNTYLSSSNSTEVASHFAPAIQKLVPGASISSLIMHARTFNLSGTWSLTENYTLVLGGVSATHGSTVKANLGFVSMDVPDSLSSGGLELNTVGTAYLVKALNSQGNQTLYYVNDHQFLTSVIPVQTTILFHLLDFSWVPSVSSWNSERNLLGQVTTLTFDVGAPRFNLTFGPKSPAENRLLTASTAVYSPSLAIVTVPAVAWLDGTFVSFDASSPAEIWMPVIAGVSLLTLLSSLLLDRNLTKGQRVRRKEKR